MRNFRYGYTSAITKILYALQTVLSYHITKAFPTSSFYNSV